MKYEAAFAKIKERLQDADTSAFTGDFAVQVNLTNKDCAGTLYVQYQDGKLCVEPYDYVDHTAMINATMNDFIKLVEGSLNVEKAVASGKVQVFRDYATIMSLQGIIKPAEKKPRVKKPAEKKVAEVKESPAKKAEKAATKAKATKKK